MNGKYLVINCGSSSLKFSLYEMPLEILLINGYVEKIGHSDSFLTIKINGNKIRSNKYIKDHNEAVMVMIEELVKNKVIESLSSIKGVGHRVLHGGEKYRDSVIITSDVLKNIVELTKLGPLHHPGEIAGIRAMEINLPGIRQVAVFDTAFHQSMPKENFLYAVPYEWYEKYRVRKYGFHGTSHRYITELLQEKFGLKKINLIICHIGSGASISCIRDGVCIDTTMGLTPLDGLIMGTRCGSIDASIIKYMMDETGMNISLIDNILNKKSGLLGICGKNDFRDVMELKNNNNEFGVLAYKMFMNSIIRYISEYYFMLDGKVDSIVFTAGVLENNALLRGDIINKIGGVLGSNLNNEANNSLESGNLNMTLITTEDSKVPVYVASTDEELMIVRDTYKLINE